MLISRRVSKPMRAAQMLWRRGEALLKRHEHRLRQLRLQLDRFVSKLAEERFAEVVGGQTEKNRCDGHVAGRNPSVSGAGHAGRINGELEFNLCGCFRIQLNSVGTNLRMKYRVTIFLAFVIKVHALQKLGRT